MNKIFIVGNISTDITTKQTSTNKTMVNFNVASNERYNNAPKTVFISCKAWDKRAEFISSYLKKGDCVCIDGHLDRRSFLNKEGKNVYVTEVIVDQIKTVGSHKNNNENIQENASDSSNMINVDKAFESKNDNSNDEKEVSWINDEENE